MGGVGSRTGLSRGREVKVMPRGQFFGDDFPSPGTIFPHPPTPIVKRTYYLQYHRLFCTWSQPTRLKRCSPLLQPSLMRLTEFKKTFTPRTSLLFLSKVSAAHPLNVTWPVHQQNTLRCWKSEIEWQIPFPHEYADFSPFSLTESRPRGPPRAVGVSAKEFAWRFPEKK